MTNGRAGVPVSLWCTDHRPMTAVPVAGALLLRRVSITAEVVFTGHGVNPGYDQAEAVGQLERAVQAAGGTLNLHTATSVMGRYQAPPVRQVGPGRPRGATVAPVKP